MNNSKTIQKHDSIIYMSVKRNLKLILSFLMLTVLTLMSCSKDDSPSTTPEEEIIIPNVIMPTMTLVSGEEGIYSGVVGSPTQGTLQHTVKANAPEGFVSLEIFKIYNNVPTSYILFDANHPDYIAGSNSFTHTLNYIMNDMDEPGHGLRFKAVVTDTNNNTAVLDFAEVDLRLPMTKKTVTLKTALPPVGDITIPYYLRISGINVTAVNHDVAVNVNNDQDIAFAFSVNDGSGFYLGSLSFVEAVISNGMQHKSTTKFKHFINAPVTPIFNVWDIYDVYNVENGYASQSFDSHQQKAEQISNIGKVFFFKTDDNRTGIMQVKGFSVDADIATLTLDLFVSQL